MKPISIIDDPDKEVQNILLDRLQNAKIGKLVTGGESSVDLNPATNKPNLLNNPNGNQTNGGNHQPTNQVNNQPIDPKKIDNRPTNSNDDND